jgi:hypothetical protein
VAVALGLIHSAVAVVPAVARLLKELLVDQVSLPLTPLVES